MRWTGWRVDVDRSSGHPSETAPGTAGVVSTLEVILGDTKKKNKRLPTDYIDVRCGLTLFFRC